MSHFINTSLQRGVWRSALSQPRKLSGVPSSLTKNRGSGWVRSGVGNTQLNQGVNERAIDAKHIRNASTPLIVNVITKAQSHHRRTNESSTSEPNSCLPTDHTNSATLF